LAQALRLKERKGYQHSDVFDLTFLIFFFWFSTVMNDFLWWRTYVCWFCCCLLTTRPLRLLYEEWMIWLLSWSWFEVYAFTSIWKAYILGAWKRDPCVILILEENFGRRDKD
jgi:hypothetical protein